MKDIRKYKAKLTASDIIIWTIIILATLLIAKMTLQSQTRYELKEQKLTKKERIEFAKSQIGINKTKDRAVVLSYLRNVGLKNYTAWCQAFQYTSFVVATNKLQIQIAIPRSGLANSSFDYAKRIGAKRTNFYALLGDLLVWKSEGWSGHVGLVIDTLGNNKVISIEGNTSSLSTSQGGAVERKMRYLNHKIGKLKVRGLVGFGLL